MSRAWIAASAAAALAWPQASRAASALPPSLAAAAASYDRAQAHGDRAALERLLADDYQLVNGGAEREDKQQLIADFTDPSFHLEPFKVEGPTEIFWSDGAVLAGEVHLRGTQSGRPFEAHTRFADVWRLANGRWQVVFTQVTRFPPSQVGSHRQRQSFDRSTVGVNSWPPLSAL